MNGKITIRKRNREDKMSKVSERDVLRKVCTRIAEIGGLKGISSRNLNNIETARKGVKELLDEYADRKYDSLKKEIRSLYKENTELKAINEKLNDENCKINREKALLVTENNKLRAEKDNLNDVISQYREIVEKLKKENKWLKEENDFLSQPWYKRFFSL